MNTSASILKNVGERIKVGDLAVFLFFNRKLECVPLDIAMLFFTAIGSLPVAIMLSAGLLLMSNPLLFNLGVNMVATLVIAQIGVQIVKRLVNRPRPYIVSRQAHPKNQPACIYSFPSGHSCAAMSVALVLAFSLPALEIPALVTAALVGVSRIYLGVHYPTDVLCGFAAAWLAFGLQMSI